MTDKETLDAYATRVDDYIAITKAEPAVSLVAFADALPEGGRVLDLGCGPGHAAKYLASRGFAAHAWDASPEMVAAAKAPGVTTRIAVFEDLAETATYDGVFASFSLLHAPRADFPRHMAAIARAIKPGGVFHLGMKTGTGEERDSIGRFYSYFTRDELVAEMEANGLNPVWEQTGEEPGLSGTVAPFVLIRAVKSA